jgi:hypothetical protein
MMSHVTPQRPAALVCAAVFGVLMLTASGHAAVSGDPVADGWALTGNSLENGVHVRGSANYGYDAYTAGLTVQSGSDLEISDDSLSWLVGDTVIGVGGVFNAISAEDAGWTSYSGNAVNSLLPTTSPYSGPKLQAKFGTADATWSASTTAPSGGNGNSSSSSGGGRVQVRTSAYFRTGTPLGGQTEPWTWDGNSGQLLVLDKVSHIKWDSGAYSTDLLDKKFARMIWIWDDVNHQVASWQLLLNVSLMDRANPSFAGLLPGIGDMAIMTVQDNDGAYTDAVVAIAPEPTSLALIGAGGLVLLRRRRR